MLISRFLFIAATCLSLSSYARNGPTYRGFYNCGFATVQFEIAHTDINVAFSLDLKWPNGTDEIVVDREEEAGPYSVIAFYWTLREMSFRTSLEEGGVPDAITYYTDNETKMCELTKRETIDD